MSSLYCLWGVMRVIRGIVYRINQQTSIWNHLPWSVCWRVPFKSPMLITSYKRFAVSTYCERYGVSGAPSISDGRFAHHWSTRRVAKGPAKFISSRCTTAPIVIFCVPSETVSSLPSQAKDLQFQQLHRQRLWLLPPWSVGCCHTCLSGSDEDGWGFDTSFYSQYKTAELCFSVLFKYCILR